MPDILKAEKLIPVFIEDEMRKSYLDYSMSMITARALPDVRDGLKPVHRRVLIGLSDIGLHHNKPTKKCANVVGHVMAKYHPHGDSADLRYPRAHGPGFFLAISDGLRPGQFRLHRRRPARGLPIYRMPHDRACRGNACRLEKDTVDFVPNYDDSMKEPSVLPAKAALPSP